MSIPMYQDLKVPPAILEELETARRAAVLADLEAEDAEREARRIRRRAKSLLTHYSNLVLEHSGQLAFLPEEELRVHPEGHDGQPCECPH